MSYDLINLGKRRKKLHKQNKNGKNHFKQTKINFPQRNKVPKKPTRKSDTLKREGQHHANVRGEREKLYGNNIAAPAPFLQ